jgi:hypothetical protein
MAGDHLRRRGGDLGAHQAGLAPRNLWVFNVERRILAVDGPVVLVDSRFPNEIALARRYGGRVVRIQRGADPGWTELATLANVHWSPWGRPAWEFGGYLVLGRFQFCDRIIAYR